MELSSLVQFKSASHSRSHPITNKDKRIQVLTNTLAYNNSSVDKYFGLRIKEKLPGQFKEN